MELFDTHCHVHEILGSDEVAAKWHKNNITDADKVVADAKASGVNRLMTVGCTLQDSALAIDFVQSRQGCWASIGIHPHEAKDHMSEAVRTQFAALIDRPKVMAIGECGLDYFYTHSPKEAQVAMLQFQVELALAHKLPLIFHVRDAFEDFWPIFDASQGIQGVIHSFSATTKELEQIVRRGLYVGLNGIMTFSKDPAQLEAARRVPLERMVLETDAPFLTPVPYRGRINESKFVKETLTFLARLRGETEEQIADVTTRNACHLFNLA